MRPPRPRLSLLTLLLAPLVLVGFVACELEPPTPPPPPEPMAVAIPIDTPPAKGPPPRPEPRRVVDAGNVVDAGVAVDAGVDLRAEREAQGQQVNHDWSRAALLRLMGRRFNDTRNSLLWLDLLRSNHTVATRSVLTDIYEAEQDPELREAALTALAVQAGDDPPEVWRERVSRDWGVPRFRVALACALGRRGGGPLTLPELEPATLVWLGTTLPALCLGTVRLNEADGLTLMTLVRRSDLPRSLRLAALDLVGDHCLAADQPRLELAFALGATAALSSALRHGHLCKAESNVPPSPALRNALLRLAMADRWWASDAATVLEKHTAPLAPLLQTLTKSASDMVAEHARYELKEEAERRKEAAAEATQAAARAREELAEKRREAKEAAAQARAELAERQKQAREAQEARRSPSGFLHLEQSLLALRVGHATEFASAARQAPIELSSKEGPRRGLALTDVGLRLAARCGCPEDRQAELELREVRLQLLARMNRPLKEEAAALALFESKLPAELRPARKEGWLAALEREERQQQKGIVELEAAERGDARAKAAIEARPGMLTCTWVPEGSRILLDGNRIERLFPLPEGEGIPVPPGDHEVVALTPGGDRIFHKVHVAPGAVVAACGR